jgi:hypothetical protein
MKLTNHAWALLAAGIISVCTAAQVSRAAITTIFDRDDSSAFMSSYPNSQAAYNTFTSSLGFFGLSTIDAAATGVDPVLSFPSTSVTATTSSVNASSNPGFMIGSQSLQEGDLFGPPTANSVFSFSHYLTAFGLYVIQGGDGANDNLVKFRLTNTIANTFVDVPVQVGPGWSFDNVFFFGITDTNPFNQVTIIEDNSAAGGDVFDGMLFDNIVIRAIPEPSSIAMLTLGACALGRLRRRR